jgi:hypothetical protein
LRAGFPHSDIYGSKLYCQLPVAFRRLTRLSSPVIAKASTTCTYSLDPITLNPQPFRGQGFLLQVFCLAFVTASIRLEWLRLDTIKTHVFHARALIKVAPLTLVRESLSYFFQIFKELLLAKANIKTNSFNIGSHFEYYKCYGKWWRMTGSNRRPPACKAGALPAELIPR